MNYSIIKGYRKNIKSMQDKIFKKFIECDNTNNSYLPSEIYFQLNYINECIKSDRKSYIQDIKYNIHSVNYDCRRLAEVFYNTKYSKMIQSIINDLSIIENYISNTTEYKNYLNNINDDLIIPF